MKSYLKRLYDVQPLFVQNLVLTGFSALLNRERYGGSFPSLTSFLEESQWFSSQELRDYQEEKLRDLVRDSYDHVPYYRRIFDECGLTPVDICTIEDLQKLPVLTKSDIKKNFQDLLSNKYTLKKVKKGHTSGTTGSPLEICYSNELIYMTYAMLDRQYKWAGVNLKKNGDRVAVIRGNVIVPLSQKKRPFWRYNYYHNQLILSSFHLSKENIPCYIDEIEEFGPKVLDGYPSTVYVLAKYLKNIGKKLKLHAVLTSSETLFDFQRETIEESFDCRIFDYFGSAERVLFATECDNHQGNHIAEEFGITEVLDNNYHHVQVGHSGTLVATSLHNRAMPLIRYVTNDMSLLKVRTCTCGRSLPLMEDVTTKAEDLLTLGDGRIISPSALTHPFKPLTSIAASQIVQEDLDHIVVRIVSEEEFRKSDELSLIHGLKERLGENVHVSVELVGSLERTRSGKFKWVISKVDLGI